MLNMPNGNVKTDLPLDFAPFALETSTAGP